MTPLDGVPDIRLDVQRMPYGSPAARFVAALIDTVILYAVSFATGVGVGLTFFALDMDVEDPELQPFLRALLVTLTLLLRWLYFAGLECSPLQATPGKMMLGLVVTDSAGDRLSFLQATGRFFAKLLATLLCFIGLAMILFDPKHQGMHDALAGTFVLAGRPGMHHALPDVADAFPAPRDDGPPPTEDITARPR